MGTSTNAMMIYGYHFGSEDALELHECDETEANEYGYFKASWHDAEHEEVPGDDGDGESASLLDLMTRRLFDAIPNRPDAEYDSQRADAVKDHYGVWFEGHCSGDYPMYVLCAASFQAYRGDAKLVDVDRLANDPASNGWDEKLAEVLRILEVHPRQEKPGWLLCSYWG